MEANQPAASAEVVVEVATVADPVPVVAEATPATTEAVDKEVAVAPAVEAAPAVPVATPAAEARQEETTPAAEAAQTQSTPCSAATSPKKDGKKPRAKPKKKPVRICGRTLDKLIQTRKAAGNFYHSRLFKCVRSSNFNCNGDMRHFDCEVLTQLGPFVPGDKLKVIDWVSSANLLFCSRTGAIADTVILPLASGAVESQVPMEP